MDDGLHGRQKVFPRSRVGLFAVVVVRLVVLLGVDVRKMIGGEYFVLLFGWASHFVIDWPRTGQQVPFSLKTASA